MAIPELDHIKMVLKKHLQTKNEILFAYLHGSSIEHNKYNDIDVAVYINENTILPKNILDYEIDMSLGLERKLGYLVDFRVLNSSTSAFAYHATAGMLLFSRDDMTRFTFIEKIWQQYFDYQHFVRSYIKDI
ncbi:MAG: nucleotidyltransferase domain-containing protein [Firmicutes bacterium]|nr:nucleotidyltransferase domain-containing protein [Bacillota bacterium]